MKIPLEVSSLLESAHPYAAVVRDHGARTAAVAERILDALEHDAIDREIVVTAAYLHDLGKLFVPYPILVKPGALTAAERDIVRKHPAIGGACLHAFPALAEIAMVVRQHHERIDGGGYPHGLRGSEIHPFARVVAVADAFVAMTEDRPYQAAVSSQRALDTLAAGARSQFDPRVVDAIQRAMDLEILTR